MLSDQDIQANKEEIINALRQTQRPGIEAVIDFLEEHDFFNLPSSLHNHHNWRGGLAQHVLEVMHNALDTYPNLPKDSIIIASLLHDLCKSDLFKIGDDGQIRQLNSPVSGHGRKSVAFLRQLGLELKPEEERSIRFHMRSMRPKPDDEPGLKEARKDSLWWAIRKADGQSAKRNGRQST